LATNIAGSSEYSTISIFSLGISSNTLFILTPFGPIQEPTASTSG